jgi:alpha-beta hydrolase superfamily lysophospholipase
MNPPRTRKYLRNIALVLGLAILIGLIVIAGSIAIRSYQFAKQVMLPPRKAVQQSPKAYGIPDYRDVNFTTEDGIVLSGWVLPPRSEGGWIVILAHGYGDNRGKMLPEAEILNNAGHGVLLFDFRGHGKSGDAPVTFGDRERLDLSAAIEFIDAQSDGRRIGALGFSMGAGVVAEVAAVDERLEAVVLESGIATLEDEINYRARAYWLFSQLPAMASLGGEGIAVDDFRPIDRLCAISPRKILLIYGELDDAVPPGTAQAMAAAACDPVELWEIPSASHSNFTEIVSDEYSARLIDFFQ